MRFWSMDNLVANLLGMALAWCVVRLVRWLKWRPEHGGVVREAPIVRWGGLSIGLWNVWRWLLIEETDFYRTIYVGFLVILWEKR